MKAKHNLYMTIGEICDRYSICKLKKERTNIDCIEELSTLHQAIQNYDGLNIYIEQLLDINGSIWSLESDIRLGLEGSLGLEEVGRRALKIRNYNKMRVNVKNAINEIHKEGFQELKSDHASSN